MTNSKQDLLSLKEENQKLNQHLKDFLKKYQGNKKYITKNKVQQLVKEHESMIKNINGRIDDIIAKDDDEDRPAKKRRIGNFFSELNLTTYTFCSVKSILRIMYVKSLKKIRIILDSRKKYWLFLGFFKEIL